VRKFSRAVEEKASGWVVVLGWYGNLLFGWLAFLGRRRQLCFSDAAAVGAWLALTRRSNS
jgi:hypothetical protein